MPNFSCNECNHRYFVADVVLIPSEGKVVLLALCTACGDFKAHEKLVAGPNTTLDSLKTQIRNSKE